MDEKAEKNRQLGEALGWTQLEWAEDDADDFGVRTVNNWHGVAPDGKRRWLPDFTGSVDACLSVLPEDWEVYFEHARPWVSKWEVCLGHMTYDAHIGNGDTRAEALAAAVLTWALAQNGAQHG